MGPRLTAVPVQPKVVRLGHRSRAVRFWFGLDRDRERAPGSRRLRGLWPRSPLTIGEERFAAESVATDGLDEGTKKARALANSVGHGRAVEIDAFAAVDLRLPV
jgi:hypothetical protein